MTARFNHTIIASLDAAATAAFTLELLEGTELPSWGPFINIGIGDGVMLQFAEPPIEFPPQHYAYLVDDAHFDRAVATIRARAGPLGRPAAHPTGRDQHRARRAGRVPPRSVRPLSGTAHAPLPLRTP